MAINFDRIKQNIKIHVFLCAQDWKLVGVGYIRLLETMYYCIYVFRDYPAVTNIQYNTLPKTPL